MEFLGNLGIDIKLLIAQIINFGLLLWLLTKFFYKPIIKRIEKDEIELMRAKTQEKKIEQQRKELEEQSKNEIAEAKNRAREIIKEAKTISEDIKNRVEQESEMEKQAVIKQIKSRLSDIKKDETPDPR